MEDKNKDVWINIGFRSYSNKVYDKDNRFLDHEAKEILKLGLNPEDYRVKYEISGMIDRRGNNSRTLISKVDGYELVLEKLNINNKKMKKYLGVKKMKT
jgi:hypothetical protein